PMRRRRPRPAAPAATGAGPRPGTRGRRSCARRARVGDGRSGGGPRRVMEMSWRPPAYDCRWDDVHMSRASLQKDPKDVAAMFAETAARYDLMNDVMSLGQSRLWRRAVVQAIDPQPGQRILDI